MKDDNERERDREGAQRRKNMPDIANRAEYEEYQERVAQFFEREGINCLSSGCGENEETGECTEPYFSWRPCDCCGCHLGGDREDCSGYNPTTEEVQGPYSVCVDCIYHNAYGRLDDETMSRIEKSTEDQS